MSSTVAALKVAMDTLTAQMHGSNFTTPRIFILDAIPAATSLYDGDLWVNKTTQALSYRSAGSWVTIYDPVAIEQRFASIEAKISPSGGGSGL